MSDIYQMAASLARPVARGYITRTEADAALLASTLAAKRQGRLPHEVRDVFGGLRHILDLHLEKERVRRMMTAHRITRRISPLVTLRKPSNAVLAEAHDVNGADGFPLAEPEVSDMADLEMYWAMPAARPRHAR